MTLAEHNKRCEIIRELKTPEYIRLRNSIWREKNPNYGKEYGKKYYIKNLEKIKQYRKRKANHIKMTMKIWREKNAEHIKQYKKNNIKHANKINRLWRKNNPDKVKKRYLKIKNNGARWATSKVQVAIENGILLSLSKNFIKCYLCDSRATGYDHRDYNKPLEVQPVCKSCNLKLGSAKDKINVD